MIPFTLRQSILRFLRAAHLLGVADSIRFRLMKRAAQPARRAFLSEHPGVLLPPDEMIYETFGKLAYNQYFNDSREVAGELLSLFGDRALQEDCCICEWGCGAGRVLRHIRDMVPDSAKVIGTDYNAAMISWASANLPGIQFLHNGMHPPLKIARDMCDVVYSISVMTHLSADLQKEWLTECLRILKPGGLLMFTVHGDGFLEYLAGREHEVYKQDGFVLRSPSGEGSKNRVSYTSPRYIREVLLRDSEIVSFIPGGTREQDMWLVRK